MGMPELLAGFALLIFVGIMGLIFCLGRSQPSASVKEYERVMGLGQPMDPSSPGQGAAPLIVPGRPTRKRWQYKYKQVSRYNSQLGRVEQVEALVLVYE